MIMQTGITFCFDSSVLVRRATSDDFKGMQQVTADFYAASAARTNLLFFAPTVEAADALVDALVKCGASRSIYCRCGQLCDSAVEARIHCRAKEINKNA